MEYQFIVAGKKGMIIHVNRQHIAQNKKDGGKRPVYTVKPNGPNSKPIYAREVSINGTCRCVYEPEPLSCGAHAWVAVNKGGLVGLIDPMSYSEAKEYDA